MTRYLSVKFSQLLCMS